MPTNDGGPAFPGSQPMNADGKWAQDWDPGMSLRDWFAGQALAGVMASIEKDQAWARTDVVESAFAIADAMLAAREQEQDDA